MRFLIWSYPLWGLNFVLEFAILWALLRRQSLPRLRAFHCLITATLLSDIIVAALLFHDPAGRLYGWAYWVSQTAEMLLRSIVAIQILTQVLREHLRKITIAALYFVLWFGAALLEHFRPEIFSMLTLSSAGNFITLTLITTAIVIPSGEWPRGWSAVGFGLFASAALDLTLALAARHTGLAYFTFFQLALQLAPIPGLLLWLAAARTGNAPPRRQASAKAA